nr:hypothetical protein [Candidatus Woesearchaeota archaeon]
MKEGKAYGFFDCRASKQEIEVELPFIRDLIQTPSKLELILMEGVDRLKGNPELMAAYEKAKSRIVFPSSMSIPDRFKKIQEIGDSELRYVIQATLPDETGKRTADELTEILNQAYQSPLYKEGEYFRGAISYEENGKYVSRG